MKTGNYFLTFAPTGGFENDENENDELLRELDRAAEARKRIVDLEDLVSDLSEELSEIWECFKHLRSDYMKNRKITISSCKDLQEEIVQKSSKERFNELFDERLDLIINEHKLESPKKYGNCMVCMNTIYLLQDAVIICENQHVLCRQCNDTNKINNTCPKCRKPLLLHGLRKSPETREVSDLSHPQIKVQWDRKLPAKKFIGIAN
jgi:hypothetical protein